MLTRQNISKEKFLSLCQDDQTRRKCFAESSGIQKNKKDRKKPTFSVSFIESVGPIYKEMTRFKLLPSGQYNNFWHSLDGEDDLALVEKWEEQMGNLVFIRDCLKCSICLGMIKSSPDTFTKLGESFKKAKYYDDNASKEYILEEMVKAIKMLPFYKDCGVITASPPRPEKENDFPSWLASGLSKEFGYELITDKFSFSSPKPQAKTQALEEKWKAWEESGLKLDIDLPSHNVLLVDDLYQSGATTNFIGMILEKAGAKNIYGLSAVKSLKNTDNI